MVSYTMKSDNKFFFEKKKQKKICYSNNLYICKLIKKGKVKSAMSCNCMVNKHLTGISQIAEIEVVCAKLGVFLSKKMDWRGSLCWIVEETHAFENEKLIKKINEYEKKLTDFDDGAF